MTRSESDFDAPSPDPAVALAALDRLGAVLALENAALRARDARALAALADEKKAAAAACERLAEAVANGDSPPMPSPSATLVRARTRLAALMEENQRRLRVAMSANQRLVETIAAAAQAKVPGAGTYARDGREGTAVTRTSNPPALTFSRAL